YQNYPYPFTMTDRVKNAANQYIGGAKQTVGEKTGNQDLASSGAAQKSQAETAQQAASAHRNAEGLGNKIQGHVQQGVGSVTGNREMEARGHANETVGNMQQRTA
ncbi:hypothetical protein BGW38_005751, partial [Lunasporangiospora selenospora]